MFHQLKKKSFYSCALGILSLLLGNACGENQAVKITSSRASLVGESALNGQFEGTTQNGQLSQQLKLSVQPSGCEFILKYVALPLDSQLGSCYFSGQNVTLDAPEKSLHLQFSYRWEQDKLLFFAAESAALAPGANSKADFVLKRIED